MQSIRMGAAIGLACATSTVFAAPAVAGDADAVRVMTFNAFLNRSNEGELIADLSTPDDAQAAAVAEIIQRLAPDVVLLNEFDFDAGGIAIDLFRDNYLEQSQNGAAIADYPFVYLAPSNTGLPSGFDLDNNGVVENEPGSVAYGNDCFGFGFFPGQFAQVLLSKYPIVHEDVRTFQTFLWADMPGALLPIDPKTEEPFFGPDELEVVRLSSKSHWDVPVQVGDEIVHILCAHPTPPVFDGPEDRNGRRNHDEIRFWADYVAPGAGDYIYDDAGVFGGLAEGSRFVIVGDYNADPNDGDGIEGGIEQLLDSPWITDPEQASLGGLDAAIRQDGLDLQHLSPPTRDTADFNPAGPGNLRADYALPSANLGVADAGVFWPCEGDELFYLVGPGFPAVSSDHRPVWVDVLLSGPVAAPAPIPSDLRLDFIGEATFETGFMFRGTEVGGLSGIAYDAASGGYVALSDDRSQIDDARAYVLTIDLGDGSLEDGDVAFKNVLPLQQNDGTAFPMFSLDPEGIALAPDGSLFIASEGDANNGIDPFVDRFTPIGRQLEALPIPSAYLTGAPEFGIRNNLAFESLTVSPDETTLFTATENALFQDGPRATVEDESPSRILSFDLASGMPASEFVYVVGTVAAEPDPPGAFSTNGLVELLALSGERLLAMERSFSVGVGNGIQIFAIDTSAADDVAGLPSIDGLEVAPVAKSLVLDLGVLGITLDNVEGMIVGPTLPDGRRSLILVSDNNFNFAGQFTQFLAFAIETCPGDANGDGFVGFADLVTVIAGFDGGAVQSDVNGDGTVDLADLMVVLTTWGPCPE